MHIISCVKKEKNNSCNCAWKRKRGRSCAEERGWFFFKQVAYLKKKKKKHKNTLKKIILGKTQGSCGQSELESLVHFRY